MGIDMSGMPSWAMTEPSMYSTIEWTMLCGWITTSMRSGGMSKSQCASITSRPLFIRVDESIVILLPIFQVGCCRACFGVTVRSCSFVEWRKGPPEAVRMIRRTSSRRWPCMAW